MEVVLGTGIDLVENARIRDVLSRWDAQFTARVFTAAERAYCEAKASPVPHFAARFAIKEAVAKALRTGIGPHMGWNEIEVERDAMSGAPSVRLHGAAQQYAEKIGVEKILISLSHTRNYAVAQAIVVGREEQAEKLKS
ncbi:MAG: holo-ACP synthase [Kiritimatiellia bacterium]